MKKLFILVLLFCSINVIISAQGDYRPGYVVMSSGDTLRGEIDMRIDYRMSKECLFRYAKGSEVQTLLPDAVKEFRFDDGRYWISEAVEGRGQLFLEYLVNGKLSVYRCVDDLGDHYFLKKDGFPISEINMPRRKTVVYVKDKDYLVPPDQLRTYLQSLTAEAPQLSDKIQRTNEFEQREFVNLAVDYHNTVCKDQDCYVYSKKMHRVTVSPQIFCGVNYNRILDVTNPEAGVYVNFWLPLENEKMYLKTGLIWSRLPYEVYEDYAYKTKNSILFKVPLQVRFLSAPARIRAEISLGPEFIDSEVLGYPTLFNVNTAANINLYKDRIYFTVGASVSTSPLLNIGSDRGLKLVSASAFGGFYFQF